MSKTNCTRRFKGVENFLRRVAYNLGNTPSQTEVKIISCIPIDVTDLQQKIIQLERQLEANITSVVHTAICDSGCYPKRCDVACSCKANSCHQSSCSLLHQSCSAIPKQSTIAIIEQDFEECPYSTPEYIKMNNAACEQDDSCKPSTKKRKFPRKKCKPQFIYYAQSEVKTPFYQSLGDDWAFKKRGIEESNNTSYLSEIVRKQYNHISLNEEANASEFSTPICRDILPTRKYLEHQPYESDMCSCCHGPFKNIDYHMSKQTFDLILPRKNAYYDSNHYDIVPVKENAVNVNNIEVPLRKDKAVKFNNIKVPSRKDKNLDMCWPESPRRTPKVPSMARPHITRKAPIKLINRKEKVLNKMAKIKPILCNATKPPIRTRSIEFGEVYAKKLKKTRHKISKLATTSKETKLNDAACSTTVITSTECQTTLSSDTNLQENKNYTTPNPTVPEDKTEATLNQIKEILHLVLAEIKTNSKINNIPEQAKKYADVQKGPSQSNICGGSSLIQSFTYSPYNMNPYSASCSQQIPTNNFCQGNIKNGQIKCMQHYPLFVQPGRCYKTNPQIQLPNMNRAASAGTNTERVRSNETENLIKEIYRSVALNIEIPTQDTPVKQHDDIKEVIRMYNARKEAQLVTNNISDIYNTTKTPNTDTSLKSKHASNETTSKSQPVRNYSQSTRKESIANSRNYKHSETGDDDEAEQISQELESDEESDDTIVNEEKSESESESSDTETETETELVKVLEPEKKAQKKGIFSKMLKIFKSRKRNQDTKDVREEQSDSDSDDYQTVYSHKVAVKKPTLKTIKSKAHSKVFFTKQPQQRLRNQSPSRYDQRSPYMEQEYRRHFDEKLTFHDSRDPRSSTRNTSAQKRPVYYQKVETRSARVEPYIQHRVCYETKQNKETNVMQHSRDQNDALNKGGPPAKMPLVHPKAMAWLKKHKVGIHCGEQWKKFILEN